MSLLFSLLVDVVLQEFLLVELQESIEFEQFIGIVLLPTTLLPFLVNFPLALFLLVVQALPALSRRLQRLLE